MTPQLMFTVYDSKAETYMPPFFVPTKGIAIRAFEDCVNSDDHHFGEHPADYTLFELGSFNTDTAHFSTETKVSIGNGVEFLKLTKLGNNNADASRINDQDS